MVQSFHLKTFEDGSTGEPRCNFAGHFIDGRCHCTRCLTGYRCDTKKACQNAGTPRGFGLCECKKGYLGGCCERKDCSSNGHVNVYGKCDCEVGFEGDSCQWAHCLNLGRPDAKGGCICEDFFSGKRCEHVVCQNGAKIKAAADRAMECDCAGLQFEGQHCEVPICYNGRVDNLTRKCSCTLLYRGDHCNSLSLFASGGAVAILIIAVLVACWLAYRIYRRSKTLYNAQQSNTTSRLPPSQQEVQMQLLSEYPTPGVLTPFGPMLYNPPSIDPPPPYESTEWKRRHSYG